MLKKGLSILLSVILVLSVISMLPVNAETTADTVEAAPTEVFEEPSTEIIEQAPIEAVEVAPTEITDEEPAEIEEEDAANPADDIPVFASKVDLAKTGSGDETYEQASCYVPNYVLTGSTVQPLYNPSTVNMLAEMSNLAYNLNNSDPSWKNDLTNKYGYTQFYHVVDSGSYLLGTKKENETYIDSNGKEQVHQVTKEKMFSGCNATVAFKEMTYNGEKVYAIAVAFKGTNFADYGDVIADVSVISNGDGIHTGFANNSAAFYEQTKNIHFDVDGASVSLYDMIQDMKNEDSPYRMLVTGHSLGGALTDTFVGYHLYKDGINPRNVMAYAFEPPKSCKSNYSYASLKKNIINIINNDDLVTAIGGEAHIGTDFYYTPNDTFRELLYGEAFEAGHDSAWWQDNLYAMIFQGAPTHMVYKEVAQVLNYVDDDGNAFVNSCTAYHTRGNNTWNSVTLDSKCYQEVGGNLTVSGIELTSGSQIIINGDLNETGLMQFSGATVNIKGNGNIYQLVMWSDSDYLLVEGDLSLQYQLYEDHLAHGTIEMKGNFHQIGTEFRNRYYTSGTHKTIFSGNDVQTVTADNNCTFYNLCIENKNVNFESPIRTIRLGYNTEINSELLNVYNLDLNGYSLVSKGDITLKNRFTVNNGEKLECHNLTVPGIELTSGSQIIINGDLDETGLMQFSGATVNIKGNGNIYQLVMWSDSDYLLVEGDLSLQYQLYEDHLAHGTIEMKGNFHQIGTGSSNRYYTSGTHKTILSGEGTQTIELNQPSRCSFSNLIINNNSAGGVEFSSQIKVTNLFNHNGCSFTLYNNGSGSTFVDYDGDGMKDNVDPYPLDPENKEPAKLGDVDGDSVISVTDVSWIQRKLARMEVTDVYNEAVGDINGDGKVNITDVSWIQRWLAHMDVDYPIGEIA